MSTFGTAADCSGRLRTGLKLVALVIGFAVGSPHLAFAQWISGSAPPEAAAGNPPSISSPLAESLKPRIGGGGTMNYIPYFTDSSGDLGNSVLYQSAGYVGRGTTNPKTF